MHPQTCRTLWHAATQLDKESCSSPELTCHTLRLQSREHVASKVESGENATPVMSSVCPCRPTKHLSQDAMCPQDTVYMKPYVAAGQINKSSSIG